MGSLLGSMNHISGATLGDTPGSDNKSRVGQGLGIPHTTGVARTVDGPKSYAVRHNRTPKVSSVGAAPKASVPKAPKMPKLGTQLT